MMTVDTCPIHNTPFKKEYDFGRLMPQPHITTYKGCRCATYNAEEPSGHKFKHCRSWSEAQSLAKFCLELWKVA